VEPQPIRPGHPPQVYIEPETLPYPKSGNGIVLPPEDEDLSLLIDEDVVTYSYLWKSSNGWEGPRGMPWLNGDGTHGVVGVSIDVGA
jgi:hypothetical protein